MRLSLPIHNISSGLSETVVRLRERIDTTSEEAVTGRYKDMTAHLSGRIGKAMLGQKAIDDVTNERTQLTLKETRLDIIQQSLTAIDDNIGQLGVRMKAALGSEDFTAREAVVRDAKAAIASTFSILNTRHGERYLFSGDATNTKPDERCRRLSGRRPCHGGLRDRCCGLCDADGCLFQHARQRLAGRYLFRHCDGFRTVQRDRHRSGDCPRRFGD
jgi:flagellin-like hook-associated protein FlgL